MKRVAILGATGSIGVQTLDVIAQHPTLLRAVGLAANTDRARLTELGAVHAVTNLALASEGMSALIDMVTADDVDVVVVAIAGAAALLPTIAAIKAGKQIALATKEVLVAAGEIVMPLCAEHGVTITPIDSEHSAIFQCLQGYNCTDIRSITLTASGGPFRGWKRDQLKSVTVEQAMNHPTWSMGGKITIDSATMMNKALEMIEAKWLFQLSMSQVQVCVHPQSVVHSLVEFNDGSMLGQLGWPDMRLPIQYALLWPQRVANSMKPWNPIATPSLTFEGVDEDVFPALRIARAADAKGGTAPCFFNAANEAAVSEFLAGRLSFLGISELVQKCLDSHVVQSATLDNLVEADQQARRMVLKT